MQKYLVLSLLLVAGIFSCSPATESETASAEVPATEVADVSPAEIEAAVAAQLDKLSQAIKDKDFAAFKSVMTDDVKIYGTDPGEAPFETEAAMQSMEEMFAAEEAVYTYEMTHRDIIVNPGGATALAVEQGLHSILGSNIQARAVWQFVPVDDTWKCDFYSVAMIPLNADLPKVDAAVAAE